MCEGQSLGHERRASARRQRAPATHTRRGPHLSPVRVVGVTTTPVPGWIELDGVDNMRDVGGLPTIDGGAGRAGRADPVGQPPGAAARHRSATSSTTSASPTSSTCAPSSRSPRRATGRCVAEPGVRIHHHTLYTEDTKETGIPRVERRLPWETDRNVGHRGQGPPPSQGRPQARRVLVEALPRLSRAPPGLGRGRPAGDRRGRRRRGRALRRREGPDRDHRRARAPRGRRHPRGGHRRLRGLGGAAPADPRTMARHPAYAANLEGKTVAQQEPGPRPCGSSSRRSTARAAPRRGCAAGLDGRGHHDACAPSSSA